MLYGNCCDLELQTSNIERESAVFSTVFSAVKRVVFLGTLKVLLKDNVSTSYAADCRNISNLILKCKCVHMYNHQSDSSFNN